MPVRRRHVPCAGRAFPAGFRIARLGAQCFKAFLFPLFRRDLVDFQLLHFQQVPPLGKAGLPGEQGVPLFSERVQLFQKPVRFLRQASWPVWLTRRGRSSRRLSCELRTSLI